MNIARLLPTATAPLLGLSLMLVGCSESTPPSASATTSSPAAAPMASAPASAASAPLPPVTVSTVKAQKKDLAISLRATGTVTPLTSVDVKPQITSTIAKVHFTEGQFVRKGQLLFTLDSRTDEANAAKAMAQLAKDQASLADAKRQLERAKQLLSQNFISQGAVDTTLAQVEGITATIAADQAAIDAAKVAVSYGRIIAPTSGRAGMVNVTAGSAVQANLTPLVTITQLDPIAVQFTIPQRNLQDALAALKGGGAKVTATLADNGGSFVGKLQFVDNAVDASSGTVKAKAVFPNKDQKLWPGAYAEINQTIATLAGATVVPQAAIVQSARGSIVFVVQDGKAAVRPVKQVYAEAGEAAVTGLKPGEVIVLEGKQNVRPNAPLLERAREPRPGASGPGAADQAKPAASDATKVAKP